MTAVYIVLVVIGLAQFAVTAFVGGLYVRWCREQRARDRWSQQIGRMAPVREDSSGLHVTMTLDEHAETMLRMMGARGGRR